MKRLCIGILFSLLLGLATASSGEEIESGLAIGQRASPLEVKDCTGPAAGKTLCYFCRYGNRPVVAVYVNQLGPQVTRLIKQVDEAAGRFRTERLAAFVVYTGDDTPEVEQQLKALSREANLRHTPLTIVREPPEQLQQKYQLASEAVVTVLMWRDIRVRDRLAFDSAGVPEATLQTIDRRIESLLE